jgi:CrcB protein
MMNLAIAVGFGGFLGAILRFMVSGYINRVFSNPIPLGTLGVNILGSFLIGFLFLYFQHINISTTLKSLIITGLLGAFTTFSTFSWETLLLIERGLFGKAILNIALNVTLSIGATLFGMLLFKRIYN